MRLFKATYKDRAGKKRKTTKWYIEFRDHLRRRRRLAAFRDKKASAEFGRKVESLVAYRIAGERPDGDLGRWLESLPPKVCDRLAAIRVLDGQLAAAGKPLRGHLEDWRASLAAKGNTKQHVKLQAARAETVIEGCGFSYFSDIEPARVEHYLAGRRDGDCGISAQTSNYYLGALKHFCRWMVSEWRAGRNPVAHLRGLNVRTDRRHDRRALTVKEIGKLLRTAWRGPVVRGMAGSDRAMLYRMALETGLRWSELRSLTRGNFDLEGNPPMVTVKAAYSKHRREDKLPLRAETAAALQDYFGMKLPTVRAFPMPKGGVGAKMLRADLDAAGIAYRDGDGRVVDFHALRHTFITNLANANVHPSVARRLARHSDVNLTLSRYTHTSLERQSDAIERLPDISVRPQAAEATGTEGFSHLGSHLAKQARLGRTGMDRSGQTRDGVGAGNEAPETAREGHEDTLDGCSEVVRAEGIEPSTYGLKVRCSA